MTINKFVKFILTSVILLCACSQTSPNPTQPCSEIAGDVAINFPFDKASNTDIAKTWIRDNFDALSKEPEVSSHTDGMTSIKWQSKSIYYSINLYPDKNLDRLTIYWEQQNPLVSRFLECYGNPAEYMAIYKIQPDGIYTYVDLFYPSKGIVANVYIKGRERQITKSTMSSIAVFKPVVLSKANLVAYLILPYGFSKNYLQPWPNDISDITFIDTTQK